MKRILKNTWFIAAIYRYSQRVYYQKILGAKRQSKRIFKEKFGYTLDLDNPQTFVEKLNALKLYYASDEQAILAGDKIGLHQYIAQKGLESLAVPMITSVSSIKEIDWEYLPNQFVIKKSNASGFNLIVKDKQSLSIEEVNQTLKAWQMYPFGLTTGEFHYEKMIGEFIIEEYIAEIANDWKIFYCNGSAQLIEFYVWDEAEVLVGHKKTVYITADITGKILEVDYDEGIDEQTIVKYQQMEVIELPSEFAKMLTYGEQLAVDFPFVRVDFFIGDGRLYLGELTFTPGAGLDEYTAYVNQWMGEKISLSVGNRSA
ncbi:MAG: ATP-grasp fold amidoligase family protein [Enterococcus sp.]